MKKLVEIDEDLYRQIVDTRERIDEKFTDSLRRLLKKVRCDKPKTTGKLRKNKAVQE